MALTHQGRLLRGRAAELIRKYEGDLGAGAAKDFAEYRYQVGYITGIKEIMMILDELERD